MKKSKIGIRGELIISITILVVTAFAMLSIFFSLLDVPLSEIRGTIFLLMFIYTIVIVVFGYYLISRLLMKPLRELVKATENISEGFFDQKLQVDSQNEIGTLAESFNKMTQKLSENKLLLEEHVNALEKVNKELEQAQYEVVLSEKWASIGRLAAGVAHEIGNPISALQGYVDIIKKGKIDSEKLQDYLRRMEREIGRIDHIIRDLLDFSRPKEIKMEKVDANSVIENTVNLLKNQGLFKKIDLNLNLQNKTLYVNADAHQLQQVVINLIINACDAMSDGGILSLGTEHVIYEGRTREIATTKRKGDPVGLDFSKLRRRKKSDLAIFSIGDRVMKIYIKDNGCGIKRDDLIRIFDPFFTTKEPGKGTGLGLAISQRVIESFGGIITADSEYRVGTTFTILLPVMAELD